MVRQGCWQIRVVAGEDARAPSAD